MFSQVRVPVCGQGVRGELDQRAAPEGAAPDGAGRGGDAPRDHGGCGTRGQAAAAHPEAQVPGAGAAAGRGPRLRRPPGLPPGGRQGRVQRGHRG